MNDDQVGIAPELPEHRCPRRSFEGAVRCGQKIGHNDMTAPIDTIAARNHGGRIGGPHKRTAHGKMDQIGGTGRGLREHVGLSPSEARLTQKVHRRSRERWQDSLGQSQGQHLAHFGEALAGGLPRVTLPASMRHAGTVPNAQAAKVVCWPD